MTRLSWLVAVALALTVACGGNAVGSDSGGSDAGPDVADADTAHPDAANPDNRPPVLFKIGDKVVAVGHALTIQMEASDPDGDALSYSIYGDVPREAQFLKDLGKFVWTPAAEDAGKNIYLTFLVTETTNPEQRDRETIEVAVTAKAEQHAPVFQKLGDQSVTVGQPYAGQLVATDPDGDTLTFSAAGAVPAGFSLDGASGAIAWTAPAGSEGQSHQVDFVVSDGALIDQLAVSFVVAGGAGNQAPVFAPQADLEGPAGQKLSFVIKATDADSDALTYASEGSLPTGASFDAGAHRFDWTPTEAQAGKAYPVAFTATDGSLSAFLEVTVTVTKPGTGACPTDGKEPNGDAGTAKPLSKGDSLDLTLCPQGGAPDLDWFRVTLAAGDRLTVTTHTNDGVNVDLDLYEAGWLDEPVAFGWIDGADEQLVWLNTAAGDYLVLAYQWGGDPTSDTAAYTLDVKLEGGYTCDDDAYEPNDTLGAPRKLLANELGKDLEPLHICPGDADVFSFDVACGASINAAIFFTNAEGDLDLYLYGPDSDTPVAKAETGGDGELVELAATPAAGLYRLKVAGFPAESVENSYSLVVETTGGGACGGCTLESCDSFQVCDDQAGECVSDYCSNDFDCPNPYFCLDSFCVDACSYLADCRPDYGCKAFEDGTYCAPAGAVLLGEGCSYTSDCAGDLVCRLLYHGGMCTRYGCPAKACPAGSACADTDDGQLCAPTCTSTAECRDGFTCQSNGAGKVCLP